jgi:hypothetical protein
MQKVVGSSPIIRFFLEGRRELWLTATVVDVQGDS